MPNPHRIHSGVLKNATDEIGTMQRLTRMSQFFIL